MVKALFDTNILIDYLNGIEEARHELNRFEQRAISLISWIEVMVGTTPVTAEKTRLFLNTFQRIEINPIVAELAIKLRREHRIKLPDALIWASAQAHSFLLVTRNSKDFLIDDPGIRLPY